jgi:epoxyqueuosine reductase
MPVLNDELITLLKSKGASLVGFADLQEIDTDIRDGLPFGVSIAVALNPKIIAGIRDGPNRLYYEEYERANHLLDRLGRQAAEYLAQKGYKAVSSAATNACIDRQTLSTRLPHKTTATRAGLGWIGKSALLVTEEYGSAIRLTTVLTDAPVAAGQPVDKSHCGECTACVEICPAGALSGNSWQAGTSRESLYNAFACRKTAGEFEKTREGVHDNICGICIATCPWTQQYLKKAI